jgi:hypothetical protein
VDPKVDWLAERHLLLRYADGSQQPVRLALGRPYREPTGDWACAVALDGHVSDLHPLVGVDAWQALHLAQGLLRQLLQALVDQGAALQDPHTHELVGIGALFSA